SRRSRRALPSVRRPGRRDHPRARGRRRFASVVAASGAERERRAPRRRSAASRRELRRRRGRGGPGLRHGRRARDLRNALASARMAFAILRRGDVGVVSRTGDLLARSLEAMQELVDPLVLAARLHAGAPVEPKRVRVARLLRDAQESIAPERGIAVLVDVDDALEIETDERVLEAALASIVQTAVRLAHEETL